MLKPLPLANAMLVFASTLFAMALASGIELFMVHAAICVGLAGQLVGAATRPEHRKIALPRRRPRR